MSKAKNRRLSALAGAFQSVVLCLFCLVTVGCTDAGFNGAGAAGAGKKAGNAGKPGVGGGENADGLPDDGTGGKPPGVGGNDSDVVNASESQKPGEGTLDEEIGQSQLTPDYTSCAARPNSKQGYPAKCADGHVMVVINDGRAQEMTCCPVKEARIFSKTTSELYIERAGRCAADEVGVGMISATASTIYCSKINTNLVELGPTQTARYAKSGSGGLSAELQSLASIYNVGDTCVCPDRMILVGGHTASDNVCQDQCVEILPRKK